MSGVSFMRSLIVIFCALFAFEVTSPMAFHCLLGEHSAKKIAKTSIADDSRSQSNEADNKATGCLSHFCFGHSFFLKENTFINPISFIEIGEFHGSSEMTLSKGFSKKIIRPPIC